MIRKTSVLGRFYPGTENELLRMINGWERSETVPGCIAAVVPHAGYVFSGESAWKALTKVDWEHCERAVIIGPSHRIGYHGLSIFIGDTYETVRGMHPYDREFAEKLSEEFDIPTIEAAHYEHSTEVQVPLIDSLNEGIPIVEFVYSQNALKDLAILISYLRETKSAIIISSDLSHYYDEITAHELDSHIEKGIRNLDMHELARGEACGKPGIEALVDVCKHRHEHLTVVDYRTSAESPYGDSHQVVGYLSAVIVE